MIDMFWWDRVPLPIGYVGVPVGSVVSFAARTDGRAAGAGDSASVDAPPIEAWGWMLCDGRQLAVNEYPELFAVLGYCYGGAEDNFNVPDYRGYFLRAVDGGRGNDPDIDKRKAPANGQADGVGSTQEDAFQSHRHTYTEPSGTTVAGLGTSSAVATSVPNTCTGYPNDSTCNNGVRTSDNETRARNIYVNYIIKFTYGP